MTDKQINIAIAEACGITGEDQWGSLYHTDRGYVRDCPDFCKDLNAMQEAEKTLTKEQADTQVALLVELVHGKKRVPVWWDLGCDEATALLSATARQRAEAFLRTLKLWKE